MNIEKNKEYIAARIKVLKHKDLFSEKNNILSEMHLNNYNAIFLEDLEIRKKTGLKEFIENAQNLDLEVYLVEKIKEQSAKKYLKLFSELDFAGIVIEYEESNKDIIISFIENFRSQADYEPYIGLLVNNEKEISLKIENQADFVFDRNNCYINKNNNNFIYNSTEDIKFINKAVMPHEKDLDYLLNFLKKALREILEECMLIKDDIFLKNYLNEFFISLHAAYGNSKKIISELEKIHHERFIINDNARARIDSYINILAIRKKINLNKKNSPANLI